MSLLLLLKKRKYDYFSLSMLRDGRTLSRKQYDSLYKEISLNFSITQQLVGGTIHCTIRRESVMGTREIFGQTIECPMPTSNHETFSFYIQSSELIN